MKTCVRARIIGRVQGVGFRPTVYRYATQLGLYGFVRNDSRGVTLEVEGEAPTVSAFLNQLTVEPPRQAVIETIQTQVLPEKGYTDFAVVESEPAGATEVHIPPDLATCDDCVRELFDPADRRHGYPFINCTNCGPRFTIIRDLPYDRPRTSMADFAMCAPCDHEYHNPADRRFHAQPDACAVCGPRLEWKDGSGKKRNAENVEGWKDDARQSSNLPLFHAVQSLRDGRTVAIKSLGGYHLACDAFDAEAVAQLRERKHRPHKPLAVMFRDLETVKRFCDVGEAEEAELLSDARPVVILRSITPSLQHSVSPDFPSIGAFLPYTPLHHLLLQHFDALVMTSGNLTDEPIVSNETELPTLLGPIADAALTHNRPIVHKCDDSVLRIFGGQRQFFRRARGFVPSPIRFADASPHILAVGGELKNTFCLARDGWAFLSQHIGDLKDFKTYEYFAHEIAEWQRLMRVTPQAIAHDMHPAYLSTRLAKQQSDGVLESWSNGTNSVPNTPSIHHSNTPLLLPVQHHHAHIASVMAEHDLHEPVIGVALDGTGYGADDTIWGGEFLVSDRADFERVAHFKQYRLPSGDKAVEEPWRMAASVTAAEGMEDWMNGRMNRAPFHPSILPIIRSGFNSPLTSSAGRLFDAVAALLGLCDMASYEAQAAIRLEAIADPRVNERYEFVLREADQLHVVDFGTAIRAIMEEHVRGVANSEISAKFHNTVVAAIVAVCCLTREKRGIDTVALSGGVFQNGFLLQRAVAALRLKHFAVFTNAAVPPNDGGLSLGQAAVAAARLGKE
jgi:hydrogenase maturation protein HypF